MSLAPSPRRPTPLRSDRSAGPGRRPTIGADARALAALRDELENWSRAGRRASLWWRDDDAARPSQALDRLLDLAERHGVPLALAVIPASAEPGLAAAVGARPGVMVIQHGYAHINHEGSGAKKSEFGAARPSAQVRAEIARGRQRLDRLFGEGFRPVFVPPWNRMDGRWLTELQGLGFRVVSRFDGAPPPPGFGAIDCHVDIIDWRGTRRFVGWDEAIGRMVGHLESRRRGRRDPDAPTGLLTHHAQHDDASWGFVEAILAATARHPAARWIDVGEAIAS